MLGRITSCVISGPPDSLGLTFLSIKTAISSPFWLPPFLLLDQALSSFWNLTNLGLDGATFKRHTKEGYRILGEPLATAG